MNPLSKFVSKLRSKDLAKWKARNSLPKETVSKTPISEEAPKISKDTMEEDNGENSTQMNSSFATFRKRPIFIEDEAIEDNTENPSAEMSSDEELVLCSVPCCGKSAMHGSDICSYHTKRKLMRPVKKLAAETRRIKQAEKMRKKINIIAEKMEMDKQLLLSRIKSSPNKKAKFVEV